MKMLIISMVLMFATIGFAQDVNVPQTVKAAFEEKYPDAENAVWKKVKENYQVQFEMDSKSQAYFSADGKWLKTAVVIFEEDLPEAALDFIADKYDEFEVKQAQEVTTHKGSISYNVVLLVGDEKVKHSFTEEGEVIEK
ncbi:hypothetical protein [Plebeiibacterium marinum]|uniref:Beta-lactamase-inhibitor-like PepSY-like domain-containing protein n=1 Tax=Plebeiibacterium marinum TaxID=2992111 RepID=A0AAE3MIB1_9BACT|nr:hypothetical protein [Plebeiobacterium marinum]MCW3807900.1 hypothetical protein [Plebeiobacterium marinum]